MGRQIPDTKAYERIVGTFKKHRNGITLADVAAGTGLGLQRVQTLVPMAADEYSARLEVTQSGEILYSFPKGFSSRYRGLKPALKRALSSFTRFAVSAGKILFKAWIMVMLIGYFLLFIAIALAALMLSMAASRNNNRGGGGVNASLGIFNLIIRIWFYSELLGAGRRSREWDNRSNAGKKKGRPLHKAIFSFVFGDEDPNQDRLTLEKKEFVTYIRKRRGVVSLPELMVLTGASPEKAESQITHLCAEFGGSPEVTGEGTIVYRFDEILLSGEKKKQESSNESGVSGPLSVLYRKLRAFSSNQGKMNFWLGLINGVNLLFGGYFLYNSVAVGTIPPDVVQAAGMYGMVYHFLTAAAINPLPVIQLGLGMVPLLFSAFFWLIPAIRWRLLKKENDAVRLDNFRSFFFSRIWTSPEGFKPSGIDPKEDACRPLNLAAAKDRLLKEMGSYSFPQVSMDEGRNEIFDFTELRREKDALEKYRRTVDTEKAITGETVFDSNA